MQPGDKIIGEECAAAAADRRHVLGRSRDIYLVLVRARIAARLSRELQWSTSRIGRKLGGRTHATVLNLLRRLPALEAVQAAYGAGRCPRAARTVIRRAHAQGYRRTRRRVFLKPVVRGTGMSTAAAGRILRGEWLPWLDRPWEAERC